MTLPLGLPPQYGAIRTPERAPTLEIRVGEGATPKPDAVEDAGKSFGDLVTDMVRDVDARSKDASVQAQDLAAGRSHDIHGTMIAVEQAGVSMRLLGSVRNRMVEAYREIMRMGA